MGLKRTLNLLDATSVGIGAIIGAGIFVVLGVGIGYAGPAIIVSIIIAGVVATFTAFSFAELGSAIPKEGGAYEFAFELISPFVGFLVGSLWLFAQIVAGAAISLGFASYFVAIFPIFPPKTVAVLAALTLTGLNVVGIKQSTAVNNILVIIKITILCLFIGFGIFYIHPSTTLSEFSPNGLFGILQGAGFIFFAYLGFGRIAALGEEVKNPERNLPLSVLIALVASVLIYVLTGFTATGLQDYRILAQSGSPIAEAAKAMGNSTIVTAVSLGALFATVSVLLTILIGLSRVAFAMARNDQLPKSIAKVSSRFGTPYISIFVMGALLTALVYVLDLKQTVAITSFIILMVHLAVNFSAIKLGKKMQGSIGFRAPLYPLFPSLGFLSCIILMLSLPQECWIVAGAVVAISAVFYMLRRKKPVRLSHSEHE
jgi:APA family basic amino acid/polyamine antiporter